MKAAWKLFSRWKESELRAKLTTIESDPLNHPFDGPESSNFDAAAFTEGSEKYQHVCSESVIGVEEPGPPVVDGAFALAWGWVEQYRFSDPIQVEAHFKKNSTLLNRVMLLEIKAIGLTFLGGVRVTEVHEFSNDQMARKGFRYDTLKGHPEDGSEWFILEKDLRTGEIKFKIASAVGSGTFPNWWTRLGYNLVGTIYRDRWHKQSYRRLQNLIGNRINQPVQLSNSNCRLGFDAQPEPI